MREDEWVARPTRYVAAIMAFHFNDAGMQGYAIAEWDVTSTGRLSPVAGWGLKVTADRYARIMIAAAVSTPTRAERCGRLRPGLIAAACPAPGTPIPNEGPCCAS